LWLKTLYRKRAVTWPFIFYTIIWTLSLYHTQKKVLNNQKCLEQNKNFNFKIIFKLNNWRICSLISFCVI
ncbi:hypothetical protein FZM86_12965, partial [Enterococcus faecium]|nr:hypothetical protein [Enterococcus faecium]